MARSLAGATAAPGAPGLGTHLQLGLPPCGFRLWLGSPCPACGLTTAFAHLARGDLLASLRAHPIGLPLFLMALLLVPLGVWGALRPRPLAEASARFELDRVAVWLACGLVCTWIARLLAAAAR